MDARANAFRDARVTLWRYTSSMTTTPTPSVALSATLDAAERGLLDVAKTLVERALDEDGRRRDDKCVEPPALVLKKMRAECATVASALARARRDILGARSKTLDGGSGEKAALLERCSALEETCGKRAEEVERFARGEASTGTLDAPPTVGGARAGTTTTTTTTVFGALKSAMQTLGLRGGETKERREEAGVASGVSTQRYSREQRAREANSGVQTRHGRGGGRDEGVRDEDDHRAGTRADDEYGSSNELGVRRGTWYAGAAESLARVGSKVIETVVERTPREELLGKRADVGASAPSTSSTSTSRVGMPKSTADRERSVRVDAMSASARLDASSETLSQCSEILANTEEIGASVLETLAAQRESLIRSGTAARSAQRNMDENLQTVKAMNSWTRLGAKPGWSR